MIDNAGNLNWPQPNDADVTELKGDINSKLQTSFRRQRNVDLNAMEQWVGRTVDWAIGEKRRDWERYARERSTIVERINRMNINDNEKRRLTEDTEYKLSKRILKEPEETQSKRRSRQRAESSSEVKARLRTQTDDWLRGHGYTNLRDFQNRTRKGSKTRLRFIRFLREQRSAIEGEELTRSAEEIEKRQIRWAKASIKREKAKPEKREWYQVPFLTQGARESYTGKIIGTVSWLVIGMIISVIMGSVFFSLAFICWALYNIMPSPKDFANINKTISGRIAEVRRNYEDKIRRANSEESRANLLKQMELDLKMKEIVDWDLLERMKMKGVVGTGTIAKEIFKILGWALFAYSFASSNVPFAKPLGIIIAFIAYFSISFAKTQPPEGEAKGMKEAWNKRPWK